MSLYGALYAGVAGLSAQSNKLGIISDNIANVNTVGYKQTTANFQALVTSSGGAAAYTPGGVLGNSEQLVTTQGLLQTTTSGTDIAVSGQGFFVVNQKPDQSGQVLYTRAGSFTQDAQGNFTNAAGFFLQAWPLDRNGLLPGEPGNVNTESSANLSSLRTVNVQNLAGTAAATTLISVGANLKSSQSVLTGATGKATLDGLDNLNSPLKGADIIVPSVVDKIAKGDTINIATGVNTSGFTYTYGGFTFGRDVTTALSAGNGENGLSLKTGAAPLNPPTVTLNTTGLAPLAVNKMTNGPSIAGATVITVNASTTGLNTGDYVTISGVSAGFDGIRPLEISGQRQITVIDPTHFSFVSNGTGTTPGGGVIGGNAGIVVTPTPLYVNPAVTGHTLVTIAQAPPVNLVVGDWVTLSGIAGPVDGLTMNGTFQVTSLDDANHYTVDSLQTAAAPPVATLDTTALAPLGAGAMVTGASVANATPITVSGVDTTGLHTGDYVTISGEVTGIDGINAGQINGQRQITVINGTSFSFVSTGTGATPGGGVAGGTGDTVTPKPFFIHASNPGHTLVTVSQPLPANVKVGSFVTLAGGTVDGINLNGSFQVTSLDDANHFTVDSLGTPTTPPVVTLNTTPLAALGGGAMVTGTSAVNATPITVSGVTTAGMHTGDYVTITGESTGIDGITPSQINGQRQITVINGTSFSFVSSGTGATPGGGVSGGGGDTVTPAPFYINAAVAAHTLVTVSAPLPTNLQIGSFVTLAGGTVDGISLDGSFQVTSINDANHFTIDSLGTPTPPPVVTLNTTALPALGAGAMTYTPGASSVITVATASAGSAGFKVGDWVNITGEAAGIDGITAGQINGSHRISAINNGVSFSFVSTGTGGVAGASGGGGDIVTPAPLSIGAVATPGATLVTVSEPVPPNLKVGQFVTLAGGTVDGINLNGSFQVTSIAADGIHYTVNSLGTGGSINTAGGTGVVTAQVTLGGSQVGGTGVVTAQATTGGNQAGGTGAVTSALTTGGSQGGGTGVILAQHAPISTTLGLAAVKIYQPAHGLVTGDTVTLSSLPAGGLGGLTQAQLTGSFIVTVIDANHYTITAPANATSSAGGGTATVANARPYIGDIFDAQNSSQTFFGVTGITGIDPNALSFNIQTAATGTVKFTYTTTSPNASLGQFNNLNNLADAINSTVGLTARVVNNRLFVGATDATQAVNFSNVQSTASASSGNVLAGVDWVRELGFQSYALGANRFNSLKSLGALVSGSTGITSALENPLGASDLKISVVDPTDTITFKDGVGNTGSLLAQLGLATSLNGGAFVAQTVGPNGPAYNPQVAGTNMASGAISPQFSRPVSVFDGLGTSHNLNIAFVKLQNNTWGVEVYAQPATDITPASSSLINGQIATGTIHFNGDGSLQSVSTSLTNLININWTNGSTPSALALNWGTQGLPFGTPGAASVGKTDGLSQFDSGYNVSFVNQNGSPVGQLTGISIDANGFITASYNNGETQKLYKIPLAGFTDANLLQGSSGNAYSQSNGSGIANLKQAGQSGVGTISPGALETSNVELAGQLTDMIVAQRAYQANTKVIQTADNLLQSLDQIIQ